MQHCVNQKVQLHYAKRGSVFDVLDDVSYTDENGKINMMVTCKGGNTINYRDINLDFSECEVNGKLTTVWIQCRTDIEPKKITCFYIE